MVSIREHIDLVGSLRLVEHNVVNPNAIDAFIRKFISRTRPEAGKVWFQKKLRSLIVNDTRYLTPLSHDDLALLPNLPDYVRQASERGEPLFNFAPANPQQAPALDALVQHMNHISDWFNALLTVANRQATSQIEVEDKTVAQKWLEKLNRIPVTEITELADQWFAKMGTRIKAEKDGVEVVMDWPTGFYAVRYTEKKTMQSDGLDLQNCLQHGMYWDQVAAGTGAVYGIRKPSDEAVVGMRVVMTRAAPRLVECKGKNNKPVVAAYVPYVVQFLTKMGFDVEGCADLKNAGIETHAGKLGTFEDVADLVYDAAGIKIWQSAARFVATLHGQRLDGTISGDIIINVSDDVDPAILLQVLNILKLPPSSRLAKTLQDDSGVFFHNGRYGDASAVGELVFTVGAYTGYRVSMKDVHNTDYATVMIMSDGDYIGRIIIAADHKIADVAGQPIAALDLLQMLNTLDHAPAFNAEVKLGQRSIYYDGKRYGPLRLLAKPDVTVGAVSIQRLGKRNMWMLTIDDEPQMRLWLKGKTLEMALVADESPDDCDEAMRQLALKYKLRAVTNAQQYGMLNTQHGLVADFASFVQVAAAIPGVAYDDDDRSDRVDLLLLASRVYAHKLSPEDQAKVYRTFRGTDIKTTTHDTAQVYDIEIPEVEVRLPDATMILASAGVIIDKRLLGQIERDCVTVLKAVDAFLSRHRYGRFKLYLSSIIYGGVHKTAKVAAAVEAIMTKNREIAQATSEAIAARQRDPDKYATDLSSRFAAMNAFRKRL